MQTQRLVFLIFPVLLMALARPLYANESANESSAQSFVDNQTMDKKLVADDSKDKLDIRTPGSELANYPNSAFTLPQRGFYLEMSPLNYTADTKSSPPMFTSEYILRYGLLDRLELRIFNGGLQKQGGSNPAFGFGPLTFDAKIHLWDEWEKYYIPAVAFEAALQTTWLASSAFNSGTEPNFSFNFDQTLPWSIGFEYNIGASRFQDPSDVSREYWDVTFQWAIQHDIVEDLAVFINGWYNGGTLPRTLKKIRKTERVCKFDRKTDKLEDCVKNGSRIVEQVVGGSSQVANVVGAGLIWTLNDHIALYCNTGAGTNASSPAFQVYSGFAWTP